METRYALEQQLKSQVRESFTMNEELQWVVVLVLGPTQLLDEAWRLDWVVSRTDDGVKIRLGG